MKKIILFSFSVLICTLAFAQVKNPIKWSFSAKKINATTYEVRLKAKIEDGWHLYSQTTPEGGPVPTSISFTKNPVITVTGTPKEEGKLEQKNEPLFGVDVKQFSDKVEFVQTVTVKAGVKTALNGTVEYMTCNDHECLPPKKQSFSIALQ